MAKRKKTRQQKMIADIRHQVYSLEGSSSISVEKTPPIPSIPQIVQATSYNYLKHDLIKTAFLTGIILAVQSILFFLLKNHILTIPKVSY